MNDSENCIEQIKRLNKKNETTDGYSLGDVLLLERFEKQLINYCGYSKEAVEELSPSYYKK